MLCIMLYLYFLGCIHGREGREAVPVRGTGCTLTEGRGRRIPGVGHQTGLAQEGMFWGQMELGETGGVCVYR